ncbi:glutathione S-transferase [Shewanella sairae]|uniref:Glutathione S-transferase n=1 Tax=Shewanella sairae TaxID=190310 RepID=A0ABQ4NYN3_9GAMM|nr:glutathione S-transferase [Shewanella sairae]MCL1131779.1 glutathione S-transferase [Shewanella sairae]GIU39998.1 glutathione S-transferase [Shewanella sairae]
MITLHHLNKSRSKRIIWLLEELGLDYQVKAYQRDSQTFLAPPELKAIHPLGKSPVIEYNQQVIAESGAITEYLIDTHAAGILAPEKGTAEYVEYLQWMHFAESSAILPLLLRMFVAKDGCQTNFLEGYAAVETEKVLSYVNQALEGKRYLVADKLTGADIMMSFIVELLSQSGEVSKYPNIAAYAQQLSQHANSAKATQLEQEYDKS